MGSFVIAYNLRRTLEIIMGQACDVTNHVVLFVVSFWLPLE